MSEWFQGNILDEFQSVFVANDGYASLLILCFSFLATMIFLYKANYAIQTTFLLSSFVASFTSLLLWLLDWLSQDYMIITFLLLGFSFIINWVSTG